MLCVLCVLDLTDVAVFSFLLCVENRRCHICICGTYDCQLANHTWLLYCSHGHNLPAQIRKWTVEPIGWYFFSSDLGQPEKWTRLNDHVQPNKSLQRVHKTAVGWMKVFIHRHSYSFFPLFFCHKMERDETSRKPKHFYSQFGCDFFGWTAVRKDFCDQRL